MEAVIQMGRAWSVRLSGFASRKKGRNSVRALIELTDFIFPLRFRLPGKYQILPTVCASMPVYRSVLSDVNQYDKEE